jgi:hypothetical protein
MMALLNSSRERHTCAWLGEPALSEPERLGEADLVQHLGVA